MTTTKRATSTTASSTHAPQQPPTSRPSRGLDSERGQIGTSVRTTKFGDAVRRSFARQRTTEGARVHRSDAALGSRLEGLGVSASTTNPQTHVWLDVSSAQTLCLSRVKPPQRFFQFSRPESAVCLCVCVVRCRWFSALFSRRGAQVQKFFSCFWRRQKLFLPHPGILG